MQIISENIKVQNTGEFSTEYIEKFLASQNFDVIRWAVVDVQKDFFTLAVARVII